MILLQSSVTLIMFLLDMAFLDALDMGGTNLYQNVKVSFTCTFVFYQVLNVHVCGMCIAVE